MTSALPVSIFFKQSAYLWVYNGWQL